MTTIGEALEHDWRRIRSHLHHQPYNATNTTPEAPMSLATIANDLKARIEGIDGEVHTFLSDHLPHLVDLADTVEQSPLVQAAMAAVLPPSVEAEIATLIGKLHEQFGGLKAAVAVEAPVSENLHAGEQPEAVTAPPAGPVIAGQAH